MIKEYRGVRAIKISCDGLGAELFARRIMNNIRKEDLDEANYFGVDLEKGIEESITRSDPCYIAQTDKGEILGTFGVVEGEFEGAAVIWFIGTETIKKHEKALVKIGYSFIADMIEEHGILVNCISPKNTPAIRYIAGVVDIGLRCDLMLDKQNGKKTVGFAIGGKTCAH